LLAMAVCQSTLILPDRPLSPASRLLQVAVICGLLPNQQKFISAKGLSLFVTEHYPYARTC
ncbi:hypothetical protein, partial [Pseudomonas sp. BF-RE-14]|uniref:hypothetical protein n=1 Tax=Pseudomonas sp. BF-RE-14 TaxID=2832356 RepID=UPI001CBA9B43